MHPTEAPCIELSACGWFLKSLGQVSAPNMISPLQHQGIGFRKRYFGKLMAQQDG